MRRSSRRLSIGASVGGGRDSGRLEVDNVVYSMTHSYHP